MWQTVTGAQVAVLKEDATRSSYYSQPSITLDELLHCIDFAAGSFDIHPSPVSKYKTNVTWKILLLLILSLCIYMPYLASLGFQLQVYSTTVIIVLHV